MIRTRKKSIALLQRAVALLLVVMCSFSLIACSQKKNTPEFRREANEITVGIAQDLDESLDPHRTVAAGTKEVLFNVYEGLVKPNADGELVGAVAERWEVSQTQLDYTFYLREGIKFQNGEEVKMSDVVYSITRCQEEGLVSGLESIVGMEANGSALTISLDAPNGEFLSYLTLAIIPEEHVEELGTTAIGTGPYRLVSRTAQTSLVLEKNEYYWGEEAAIDKATFLIYENAEALVMALKSGAVDLCAHLTATQADQLGEDFQVLEGTMNLVQAVYLNHNYEPFSNEKVRQALCYALDRQQVFDMIANGHGTALGSSIYPNFRKYFLPELAELYPHDTDKAKALLAEAGYPEGFSMKITVPSNYQPHVDTAQVVAEQFRAIGVEVTIETVEWGTWLSEVYANRQFEATIIGFDASTLTARALLERFTSDASGNMINQNNSAYDAAFDAALHATSEEEQTEAYLEMERILAETAANVYIQDLADLVAVRSGLEGYQFYPLYVIDLSTIHYQ